MTSDEVYKLIEDNGLTLHGDIEHFAALVAAHALVEPCCGNYNQCQKICMPRAANAEREACAIVCDDINAKYKWPQDTAERVASQWCADAIRARGNT